VLKEGIEISEKNALPHIIKIKFNTFRLLNVGSSGISFWVFWVLGLEVNFK
jgi:hypothetical protein